jgi:hypothetical protein
MRQLDTRLAYPRSAGVREMPRPGRTFATPISCTTEARLRSGSIGDEVDLVGDKPVCLALHSRRAVTVTPSCSARYQSQDVNPLLDSY